MFTIYSDSWPWCENRCLSLIPSSHEILVVWFARNLGASLVTSSLEFFRWNQQRILFLCRVREKFRCNGCIPSCHLKPLSQRLYCVDASFHNENKPDESIPQDRIYLHFYFMNSHNSSEMVDMYWINTPISVFGERQIHLGYNYSHVRAAVEIPDWVMRVFAVSLSFR